MIMGRLMCIPPAQGFQRSAVTLIYPDQRIVQRKTCHVRTGLDRRTLDDVTPDTGTFDIAKHALNKKRVDMNKLRNQRPQFILYQPDTKGA